MTAQNKSGRLGELAAMSYSSSWKALKSRPRTHTNHSSLGLYIWGGDKKGGSCLTGRDGSPGEGTRLARAHKGTAVSFLMLHVPLLTGSTFHQIDESQWYS